MIVDRLDVCNQPKDAPYILRQFDLRMEKHHQFYVNCSVEVTQLLEDKYIEVRIVFLWLYNI